MNIAYITTYDLNNRAAWPRQHLGLYGAGYKIYQLLQEVGHQVHPLGPLPKKRSPITRAKWLAYRHLFKQDFYSWADPLLSRDYARQIQRQLANTSADIVLCPENTIPIARLKVRQPLVLWTDALIGSLVDFYPYLSNLCGETRHNLFHMEQAALDRCDRIILTSDWASASAQKLYTLDPAKLRVLPRGSNQETDLSPAQIEAAIGDRPERPCRLLFVGVDWRRKGGPMALEVARQLNQNGLETELLVVGCRPKEEDLPDFVKLYGFINRAEPEGRRQFEQLFCSTHFLILPTRADTFGIVLSEANSFGLPALATQVGGIPTLLREGKNGKAFPLDAPAAAYCEFVLTHMADLNRYRQLATSAYQEFCTRLSWSAAQQQVQRYLDELVHP